MSEKAQVLIILDVNAEILSCIRNVGNGFVECKMCLYQTRHKVTMRRHVEAKHVDAGGVVCEICLQFCRTSHALTSHKYRKHSNLRV